MCSLKSPLHARFCHWMRREHIMIMCAALSLRDRGRLLSRGSANRCRNDRVMPVRGDCRSCLRGMGEDCFGKQAVGDTNDSHLGWESAQFQLNQTWIDDDCMSSLLLDTQSKTILDDCMFRYDAASWRMSTEMIELLRCLKSNRYDTDSISKHWISKM